MKRPENEIDTLTITPVTSRKIWHAPAIEDANIGSLTNGTGTSGVEGSAFLKPGS